MDVFKTKIGWTASADVEAARASGQIEQAGYAVLVILSTKEAQERRPLAKLPPDQLSYEIEAPAGVHVAAFVSAIAPDGTYSPATPIEFGSGSKPPARPTNIEIVAVSKPLPVLATAPAPAVPAEPRAIISGHPKILDGEQGKIISTTESNISVEFDRKSLNAAGRLDGHTIFELAQCKEYDVQIILPDQNVITLPVYLQGMQDSKAT